MRAGPTCKSHSCAVESIDRNALVGFRHAFHVQYPCKQHRIGIRSCNRKVGGDKPLKRFRGAHDDLEQALAFRHAPGKDLAVRRRDGVALAVTLGQVRKDAADGVDVDEHLFGTDFADDAAAEDRRV